MKKLHKILTLSILMAVLCTALVGIGLSYGPNEAKAEDATEITLTYSSRNDSIMLFTSSVALGKFDHGVKVYVNDVLTETYAVNYPEEGQTTTDVYLGISKEMRFNDASYLHVVIPAGTKIGSAVVKDEYNFYQLARWNQNPAPYVSWGQEKIGTVDRPKSEIEITGMTGCVDQADFNRYIITLPYSGSILNADGTVMESNNDYAWNQNIWYVTDNDDPFGGYTAISKQGAEVSNSWIGGGALTLYVPYANSDIVHGTPKFFKIPANTVWGGDLYPIVIKNDVYLYYDGSIFNWLGSEPTRKEPVSVDEVVAFGTTLNGFAFSTATENGIPVDNTWGTFQHQAGQSIFLNGEHANGIRVKKVTETVDGVPTICYYLCFADSGVTLKETDIVTVNGMFRLGAEFYSIKDAFFAYVNGCWKVIRPEFQIKVGETAVEGDVIAVEIGADASLLTITASDYFDENIAYTVSDYSSAIVDGKFVKGSYPITLTATDSKGYSTTKEYTLKVDDTVAPVITVNSLAEQFNEGEQLSYDVTATDNIDGEVKVTCLIPTGMLNGADKLQPGVWTLTFVAIDSAENETRVERVISVKDITAPEIVLAGETVYEAGAEYAEGAMLGITATATDNYDAEITGFVTVMPEGAVIGGKLQKGTWTVTVNAQDAAGNIGAATVEITVNDTVKPVITLAADNKTQYNEGDVLDVKATAEDSYEGEVEITVIVSEGAIADGKLVAGEWTVTLTAKDTSLNEETKSYKIIVLDVDNVKPVITVTGELEYVEGAELNLSAVAQDDVDGIIDVSRSVQDGAIVDGKLTVGEWTVTYTATDAAGNEAVETVTIKVTAAKVDDGLEEKSCGGAMGASSAVMAIVAFAAAAIIRKKR